MLTATPKRARIHGGNWWAWRRQIGGSQTEIRDFSVDLNPLGFPESVRSLILRHLDEIQYYPDPEAQALREAIAAAHHIPVGAVLPANGSAELIGLIARCRPIRKAVVVVPTFGEYAWAVEPWAVVDALPTEEQDDFQVDLRPDVWQPRLAEADVVFLCNPNNPTGTLLPRTQVLRLAEWCRRAGALLVVDEAFVEFTEDPDQISVLPDSLRLGNVLVLRSLTKGFAIPGLRLGYLVADEAHVHALRALQSAWPLNTFALAVGAHLCKDTDYLPRSRRVIAQWREEFRSALQTLPGLRVFPSTTNFLLCKLESPQLTSSAVSDRLAAQGLLIRTCDSFQGLTPGRFIRLAVRTPQDNARLVCALREVLTDAHSTSLRAMVSEGTESNHAG